MSLTKHVDLFRKVAASRRSGAAIFRSRVCVWGQGGMAGAW